MNHYKWVIDTTVLYKTSYSLPAISLLGDVVRYHAIAIDSQDKIRHQYLKCFEKCRSNKLLKGWWKIIVSKAGKVNYYNGKLPQRICQTLFNNLSFHRKDEPFVAVASNTKDKLLVSEDGDYTSQIKSYLKTKLKIEVLLITEALQLSSTVKIP